MVNAPYYPKADRTSQDFASRYPGAKTNPNVVVLHTTETGTWPSYSGGATAPNFTVLPDISRKRLTFRQHFPVNMSSRALRNEAGGVETNTLNAVQVELIGTCSKAYRDKYGYFYWPDAPDWALKQLGQFLTWLSKEWPDFPVKDAAPRGWAGESESPYGTNARQRMTFSEWRNAYGIVGHQHVPENSHWDPGNFPIQRLLELTDGKSKVTTRSKPKPPTPVQQARAVFKRAGDRALKNGKAARAQRFYDALDVAPKR